MCSDRTGTCAGVRYAVLIAGIGNELAGDDGIGVAAIRELRRSVLPPLVCTLEVGTAIERCVPELTTAGKVIWIDAIECGVPPGTIYRMGEGELLGSGECGGVSFGERPLCRSAHGFSLAEAVCEARLTGNGLPREAVLFGMQPFSTHLGIGLSPGAMAALPRLLSAVLLELAGEDHRLSRYRSGS